MTIRILHVVHGLARGGLENGVVNLLDRLPEEEFEQAVCCLDQRGEMADRIRRNLPLRVLNRGRHDLKVPWQLARWIRQWRPAVVHCRNWNTWPDAAAAHLLSGRRQRLVWSFHGFADRDELPLRRRVASRGLARITDHLVAVCGDAAARFAARSGVPRDRFEILYNGVDVARFAATQDHARLRAELGLALDAVLVITVASLIPVKDHSGLLRAAAPLLRAHPHLHLLWIGDGPQRADLQRQIQDAGLSGRVSMPGNSDQVPKYLAAADLFALPSRLEGMNNAILEAMASGLPVVARRVGGNPELIEHEIHGLLSDPNDDQALGAALSRLVSDGAWRRQMGVAARQRALTTFSLDAMIGNYADFYRRLATGAEESSGASVAEGSGTR